MKIRIIFFFSCLSIVSLQIKSQPKNGEAGSKGTYKTQEFYNVLADSNNIKEGPYELWYEGVKIVSGQYLANMKTGLWKQTNLEDDIFFQGNYRQNKKTGAWRYFKNKKPLCNIYYKNDIKDSTWRSFYENSHPMCIMSYSNGKKVGPFTAFYENDSIFIKCFYENDNINGTYLEYYKTGQLKENIEYYQGHPMNILALNDSLGNPLDYGAFKDGTGLMKKYYQNGKVLYEANYLNGRLEGHYISFYKSGKIKSKGQYQNDKLVGKWVYYDKEGNREWSIQYTEETEEDKAAFRSFLDDESLLDEQLPKAQGGDRGMIDFLRKNLRYPQLSKEAGISGTVYVEFTVTSVGKLRDLNIKRGVSGGPDLDREAILLVNRMPPWTPGFLNGFPVEVQFTLPIKFSLR